MGLYIPVSHFQSPHTRRQSIRKHQTRAWCRSTKDYRASEGLKGFRLFNLPYFPWHAHTWLPQFKQCNIFGELEFNYCFRWNSNLNWCLKCVKTCRRLLKNRIYHVPPPKPELGHPLRVTVNPRKEHTQSIDKQIRMYFKFAWLYCKQCGVSQERPRHAAVVERNFFQPETC